jgi:hypothetical protein
MRGAGGGAIVGFAAIGGEGGTLEATGAVGPEEAGAAGGINGRTGGALTGVDTAGVDAAGDVTTGRGPTGGTEVGGAEIAAGADGFAGGATVVGRLTAAGGATAIFSAGG